VRTIIVLPEALAAPRDQYYIAGARGAARSFLLNTRRMLRRDERRCNRGASCGICSSMARIVLISDDDALRQDMRSLVTGRGHSMLERPAGDVGRAGGLREPVDAAFVDLSAAGDHGLAMIVRTRLHMPDTRIAVIDGGRGCDSLDWLAHAVSLGADDFMKKPVLVSDAADVLERLGL
jgi:ActR/RegA family two-component response regulator